MCRKTILYLLTSLSFVAINASANYPPIASEASSLNDNIIRRIMFSQPDYKVNIDTNNNFEGSPILDSSVNNKQSSNLISQPNIKSSPTQTFTDTKKVPAFKTDYKQYQSCIQSGSPVTECMKMLGSI